MEFSSLSTCVFWNSFKNDINTDLKFAVPEKAIS